MVSENTTIQMVKDTKGFIKMTKKLDLEKFINLDDYDKFYCKCLLCEF